MTQKIGVVGHSNTFANLAITPTNQLVQINEPFKEEPISITELSIHPQLLEYKTGKELRRERRKAERNKKK